MKYSNYLLAIGMMISLLMACTQAGERADDMSLENTRPKGQASVVDNESEKNILQLAAESESHTNLVAAVEAAQIEHVLVNAGPLTVFAPVNTAFDALPAGAVEDLLRPENKAKLASILTLHAAPGSYDRDALIKSAKKGRKLYMATGDYLDIVVIGDEVMVGGAKILSSIPASNGIIHVVDKLILPTN